MTYMIKARELGEAIARTPEAQALKSAEAAIMADPKSRGAFLEYQEKERNLVTTQMLSKVVPEKESLAQIDLRVRLISKYPLIKVYFQQQQGFEKVMATVNLALTTAIHGMPSADQLPIPDELKKVAQQVLDRIGGGNPLPKMEVPQDLKSVLPKNLSIPGLTKNQPNQP